MTTPRRSKRKAGPSDYELEREAKIERNNQYLASLGLGPSQVKQRPPRTPKQQRPRAEPRTGVRRSTRFKAVDAQDAQEEEVVEQVEKRATRDWEGDEAEGATWVRAPRNEAEPRGGYSVEALAIREQDVAKVTDKRGFSLQWHPTLRLIAAGAVDGQVGVWDVDDEDDESCVRRFAVHTRPVSALAWQDGLVSASYDSSVRRLDAQRSTLLADYAELGAADLAHAAFVDNLIIGAHTDGTVTFFDQRAGLVSTAQAHARKCCHASVAGGKYATSGIDGFVKLFDLRSSKTLLKYSHSKGVRACALTATTLASISYDDTVAINDDFKRDPVRVRHDNKTGRYLTPFEVCFDPHAPTPTVIVGSMQRPRAIDLIAASPNMNRSASHSLALCRVRALHDDDNVFHSVTSIHHVHATHHIIAGINNSGRVLLWR